MDNQTLTYVLIGFCLLTFSLQAVYAIVNRGRRGTLQWSLAFLFLMPALTLLSFQKILPNAFLIPQNLFFMLGYTFMAAAIHALWERKVPWGLYTGFLAATMLLLTFFTIVWPSIQIRIVVFSLSAGFLLIEPFFHRQAPQPDSVRAIYGLLKTSLLVTAGLNFVRVAAQLFFPIKGTTLLSGDWVTSLYLFLNLVSLIAYSLTFPLTQNALLQAELAERNRELADSNKTKDRLFAILAHDLRGPVGSIATMLDYLLQTERGQDEREEKLALSEAAQRTYQLLGNLLDWARSQSENFRVVPVRLDLPPVVQEALTPLEPLAQLKKVVVDLDIPNGLTVFADPNLLKVVVRNLVANALKFTPSDGKVAISAWRAERQVVIAVADSGIGMDAKTLETLFTLDKTVAKGTHGELGTGLGLLVVKDFVEKSGGGLDVRSELGRGTTFTVHLPATSETVETPVEPVQA